MSDNITIIFFLLLDSMYQIFLFLWNAYCRFFFRLLSFLFLMFTFFTRTGTTKLAWFTSPVRMCGQITMANAIAILTSNFRSFSHLFPLYCRSSYHYLLFSICWCLPHSIHWFVLSSQQELHPSP